MISSSSLNSRFGKVTQFYRTSDSKSEENAIGEAFTSGKPWEIVGSSGRVNFVKYDGGQNLIPIFNSIPKEQHPFYLTGQGQPTSTANLLPPILNNPSLFNAQA